LLVAADLLERGGRGLEEALAVVQIVLDLLLLEARAGAQGVDEDLAGVLDLW
jgi:hypothetical protein